jgi:predicted alpha/beta superfamily hydrolase
MNKWLDYRKARPGCGRSIAGTLRLLKGVDGGDLGNRRDLLAWLPPSYRRGRRRYPVLYFHDGQNLFDPLTSFAGDWRLDETMRALAREGIEAIVVGISNTGRERNAEYNPFPDATIGPGRGDAYLRFVAETVKPLVDDSFRTRAEPEHTGIVGSSLGGLISLYAFFARPELFGMAGAFSPSLWIGGEGIFPFIDRAPRRRGRIYIDVGTRESGGTNPTVVAAASRRHCRRVLRMRYLLERKLERPGEALLHVQDEGGTHNEADWARRLPGALRFLLAPPQGAGA